MCLSLILRASRRPCSRQTVLTQVQNNVSKKCSTQSGINSLLVETDHFYFPPGLPPDLATKFANSFTILDDFVSSSEEESLLREVEPHLVRQRYEDSHWDDAIHGFRETERKLFNKTTAPIVEKIKTRSFPSSGKESLTLPYTHVLDLADYGHIKPHVDSVRFCGSTVAVLSLLSDCVGRFRLEEDKSLFIDALIPRRSLYIMKGSSRYDFTHEILHNSESTFRGKPVEKGRRISFICRNSA